MKMHLGKTKVMLVSRAGEGCNVTIDAKKIEEVQSVKYLGQISVLMGHVMKIANYK